MEAGGSNGGRDNDGGQLKEGEEYFHQINKKIFQIKTIMSQILFDKRILF